MMNILINAFDAIDPVLMEELVSLPETSIYLSLSMQDTMRILHENHPEILITDKQLTPDEFLSQLTADFPELEIYLYDKTAPKSGTCSLIPFPKTGHAGLSGKQAEMLTGISKQRLLFHGIDQEPETRVYNMQTKRRSK